MAPPRGRLAGEVRPPSPPSICVPYKQYASRRTHDKLVAFTSSHGFDVTPHYLGVPTAWRAIFSHASSSASADKPRVIGVNSEMDALPGVGHACGHNLIAIAGVGVALAIKAALEKHDVSGKVVLLGTPGMHSSSSLRSTQGADERVAEEGGGGKITLLDAGAYDEMDACIMYVTSSSNWQFAHTVLQVPPRWRAGKLLVHRAFARVTTARSRVHRTRVCVHPQFTKAFWADAVL